MKAKELLPDLLRHAEAELASVRGQRAEIDRVERTAAQRVAHLRALIELEGGDAGPGPAQRRGASAPVELPDVLRGQRHNLSVDALSQPSQMRIEDIAAEILTERGPLHYRELWDAVALRGGTTVSGDPAAVLLTRITRDDRFTRAGRGMYALAAPGEPAVKPRKRRRRNARRATKKSAPVTGQK